MPVKAEVTSSGETTATHLPCKRSEVSPVLDCCFHLSSARGGKADTPSPLAVSEHKSVVKVVSADVTNGASKKFEVIPRS